MNCGVGTIYFNFHCTEKMVGKFDEFTSGQKNR